MNTEEKPKMLNEAEILSIKRLYEKGLNYYVIADRIGISVERVLVILNKKIIDNDESED